MLLLVLNKPSDSLKNIISLYQKAHITCLLLNDAVKIQLLLLFYTIYFQLVEIKIYFFSYIKYAREPQIFILPQLVESIIFNYLRQY